MCGIIYCRSTERGKKVCKSVLKRYQSQKTRGKEGFGFVEVKEGIIIGIQRAQTEKDILEKLAKSEADEILFHHRFPTSTPNFVESTHPIFVSHEGLMYNYYVVHNGILSNDDELREEHLLKGFDYTTDTQKQYVTKGVTYYYETEYNDSEALAIDFALSIEKNRKIESRGSIALVALQVDKVTNAVVSVYWGRNKGNPLKVEDYHAFLSLSSETGKDVEDGQLFKLDVATLEIYKEKKEIGFYFDYKTPSTYYPHEKTMGFAERDSDEPPFRGLIGKGKKPQTQEALEEEDYVLDLAIEIEHLEQEIKKAYTAENYDKACELETELEGLKAEYNFKAIYD